MTDRQVFLQSFVAKSVEPMRVPLTDDFHECALLLFQKVYGKSFTALKCWAVWPGDRAAVWVATSWRGARQEWLHLSFSDCRGWLDPEKGTQP